MVSNPNPVVRDADDLWRVYRHEWVIAYTAEVGTRTAEDADQELRAHFDWRYAGRVHLEDVQMSIDEHDPELHRLLLRLPVLKGEFKHRPAANALRTALDDGRLTVTVVRNSREDHDLRAYGTRALPVHD